jgi:hypothetical protein
MDDFRKFSTCHFSIQSHWKKEGFELNLQGERVTTRDFILLQPVPQILA